MRFSDEELIAYLLKDATPELAEAVEKSLATDERLVDRINDLRHVLGHLDAVNVVYEPPADLCDLTFERIQAEQVQVRPQPVAESLTRSIGWDSLALVTCVCLLLSIVLPSIVVARHQSRRLQCAENVRMLGTELTDYASSAPGQRFPEIPTTGPTAFAGLYSAKLRETGRLTQVRALRCVGRDTDDQVCSQLQLQDFPAIVELVVLPESELRYWQRRYGGDYAYCLGVIERDGDRPVGPKLTGSSAFAILSDAPEFSSDGDRLVGHEGLGVNVFYQDGRVDFVSSNALFGPSSLLDHPLRNHDGRHQSGLNTNDASLAPSQFAPIGELEFDGRSF